MASKESINQDLAPGAWITFERKQQCLFCFFCFSSVLTVQTQLNPGAKWAERKEKNIETEFKKKKKGSKEK